MPDTTIRVPTEVRDRLRAYGVKGQSYADIIEKVLDEVDYRKFLREQLDLLDEASANKGRLAKLRDL